MLLTRRSPAALRYSLLCALFFLFLGGGAVTFLIEWNGDGNYWSSVQEATGSAGALIGSSALGQWMEKATAFLNENSHLIVGVWSLVFAFKSAKMLLDLLYIRRLRRHGTMNPSKHWAGRIQTLGRALGIRKKVSVVESALVKIPIVIGYFKPLILLPASLLTHMPAGELEAILFHELAHIRRHDYLVNFIQRFSELLFFFNPGLLWVSSLLRIERENCCDDVAVFHTENKTEFVEALIRCKERSLHPSGYALGLFGKKNLLLQRLTRIVYNRNQTLSPFEVAFSLLSLVALTVLLSGMGIADRPVLSVVVQPLVESSPSRNDSVSKKTATEQPPKQAITKRVKNRPGTEIVKRASPHSTGQKNQMAVSPANVLEADKNLRDYHTPVFATSNPYPEPVSEIRNQLSQASFEDLRRQAEQDRKQAESDRAQAEKDREQAMKDRKQAGRDREQAQKDRVQAEKDREQSMKDRAAAERSRAQAEQDRRLHGFHP